MSTHGGDDTVRTVVPSPVPTDDALARASLEALAEYQAAKRAYKAELRAAKA